MWSVAPFGRATVAKIGFVPSRGRAPGGRSSRGKVVQEGPRSVFDRRKASVGTVGAHARSPGLSSLGARDRGLNSTTPSHATARGRHEKAERSHHDLGRFVVVQVAKELSTIIGSLAARVPPDAGEIRTHPRVCGRRLVCRTTRRTAIETKVPLQTSDMGLTSRRSSCLLMGFGRRARYRRDG